MIDRIRHPLWRIIEEAPCTLLLVPFCVGIVLSEKGWVEWMTDWMVWAEVGALFLVALAIHYLYKRHRLRGVTFYVPVFALCMLLGMVNARNHAVELPSWPQPSRAWRGIVAEEPRQTEKCWRLMLRLDSANQCRKVQLSVLKRAMPKPPTVGEALEFCAQMKQPYNFVSADSARGSAFDYAGWLRRQGCVGQAFTWEPPRELNTDVARQMLGQQSLTVRLQIFALQLRSKLTERYRVMMPNDDEYSVLAALTLGSKSELTSATRQTFSSTGASHVLALSGLHLGILVSLLVLLLRPLRSRRSMRWFVTVALILMVWAFVLLTGCSISIIRAATMLTIMLLASLRGEGYASLNNLLLAVFVILALSPQSIMDVGFQLSFVAVFFILYFNPYFQDFKRRLHRRALWPFVDFLYVTVVAQLATAPIVASVFGQLPVWFLLTNIIVIPCAYALLCGALLFFALSWWTVAATFVGEVLQIVTHAMLTSLQWIAALPMASVSVCPTALTAFLCYPTLVALFAWLVLRRRHYMYATILLVALIVSIECWVG